MSNLVSYKIFSFRCLVFYTSIFLFSACTNPYKNLTKTEYPEKSLKIIPYYLPSIEKAIIYKADITFYNNNFAGLLVIKRIEENNYRLALTTQFGLKIFDFELNQGQLKAVFCIEQLNKKMILNLLEDDFNLLLLQLEYDSFFSMQNKELNQNIWLLTSGKMDSYYIQNNDSESIDFISKRKRNSEKISVGLRNYRNGVPGEINLKYIRIKHSLNLKLLQ